MTMFQKIEKISKENVRQLLDKKICDFNEVFKRPSTYREVFYESFDNLNDIILR